MSNYFRITAYNPAKNICAIFDSNGRFEKLWQFSAYLVQKGFKIVEVGSDDKFIDGNIPKVSVEKLLILRACAKRQPVINGDTVEVNGRNYKPGTYSVPLPKFCRIPSGYGGIVPRASQRSQNRC